MNRGDLRVGQAVFDRMEGAYGDAELSALTDVCDRSIEQRQTDAECLARGAETGPGNGVGGARGDLRVEAKS
nr:hypothetical protein [Streptomyces sp. HUAS 15-9]